MGKQRRSYTEEFKAEAVRAATAGDRSLTQVARDVGVNASVLQNWKQRLTAATGEAAGKRDETLEQELRRLRRENASLREDREILKKGRGVLCEGTTVKYAFIDGQRTQHPVRRLRELLDVSSAGYYEWRDRPCSSRSAQDERLRAEIVRVHAASRKTYGRPRIHTELREKGLKVGAKRVARLMKTSGIQGVRPRRFVRTTDSKHTHPFAENILARTFDPNVIGGLNRVYAGDITYLPTREGWLYLAVVLDLGSRRVVGWSMTSTMHDDLVIDALEAALGQRRPQGEVLFHSDRGSQYASYDFRATADRHNVRLSMSGKGDCWDNAVVESFFGTLKTELGDPVWPTRDAARSAVFNYIESWYNPRRRHSALGYVSPIQYESLLPIAA